MRTPVLALALNLTMAFLNMDDEHDASLFSDPTAAALL
jgi:hypothetical protein